MDNLKDPEVQAGCRPKTTTREPAWRGSPAASNSWARIRELDQSVPWIDARRLPCNAYIILKRLPSEDVLKLYPHRGLNGKDELLFDPEKTTLASADQDKSKNVTATGQLGSLHILTPLQNCFGANSAGQFWTSITGLTSSSRGEFSRKR